MASTPKLTLHDDYASGLVCAICGADALSVNHIDGYPDYVSCANCSSAYVVEDGGERVMYGNIPQAYSETRRFALRQWAWPEAIARKAAGERPSPDLAPAEPAAEAESVPPDAASQDSPPQPEPAPDVEPADLEVEEEAPYDTVTPLPSLEELNAQSGMDWQPGVGPSGIRSESGSEQDSGSHSPAFEAPFMMDDEEEVVEEFDVAREEQFALPDWMGDGPMEEKEAAEGDEEDFEDLPLYDRPQYSAEDLAAAYWRGDELKPVDEAQAEAVEEPAGLLEPEEPSAAEPEPEAVEAEPGPPEPTLLEPSLGERYRVLLQGGRVRFPGRFCAHCLSQPVRGRLAIAGTLPNPRDPDRRNAFTFQIPLCTRCRRRAAARSDAERSARITAHLASALVALALVVVALAARLVTFDQSPLTDAAILLILAVLGYGVSVLLLLSRASRYPSPPDAAFVQSTLITPADAGPGETAFEWRNRGYAEAFVDSNRESAVSGVTRVQDRTFQPDSMPAQER